MHAQAPSCWTGLPWGPALCSGREGTFLRAAHEGRTRLKSPPPWCSPAQGLTAGFTLDGFTPF